MWVHLVALKIPDNTSEKAFKLTESQSMSPAYRYLGPETPAIIFVVLLLGFKVMLLMSFTVAYIHRWWNV